MRIERKHGRLLGMVLRERCCVIRHGLPDAAWVKWRQPPRLWLIHPYPFPSPPARNETDLAGPYQDSILNCVVGRISEESLGTQSGTKNLRFSFSGELW